MAKNCVDIKIFDINISTPTFCTSKYRPPTFYLSFLWEEKNTFHNFDETNILMRRIILDIRSKSLEVNEYYLRECKSISKLKKFLIEVRRWTLGATCKIIPKSIFYNNGIK